MINNIISCEFNIDTACVEVKLADGSMVSIDCIAVENEYADNMYESSELDYLIYNDPASYVKLIKCFSIFNTQIPLVYIAERCKPFNHNIKYGIIFNNDINVNNRFCGKPLNRGTADMLNPNYIFFNCG